MTLEQIKATLSSGHEFMQIDFIDLINAIETAMSEGGGGAKNYKEYAVLLNQTSEGNPVPTILNNDFDDDITYIRNRPGSYTGTLTGGFPQDKTIIIFSNNVGGVDIQIYFNDENSFDITTAGEDDQLTNYGIIIRVYN